MLHLATYSVSFSNPSFIGFMAVAGCDCVFIGYFSVRQRAKRESHRRAPLSIVGIVLQAIAWTLIGSLYRMPTQALRAMPFAVEIALAVLAAVLAIASIWLCVAAVNALGKEWTYVAAVGEQHELVMRGPYSHLRHPIYAGMTGLVIASALAMDRWWAVPIILAFQFAGTWIRVREEDRLLRLAHGSSFAAYAAKVPAMIPCVSRGTAS